MDVKITAFLLITLLANFASAEMVPITEMRTDGGYPGAIFQHRYVTSPETMQSLYNKNDRMIPLQVIGYISDIKLNGTKCVYVVKAFDHRHPYVIKHENNHQISYNDHNLTGTLFNGNDGNTGFFEDSPLGWIFTSKVYENLTPLYIYDGIIEPGYGDQVLSTENIPWILRYDTLYTNHGLLGYVISKENSIGTKTEQGQISKLFSYIWGVIT